MVKVELDQIVAKQEVHALREVVQLSQCLIQVSARPGKDDGLTSVGAYPSEGVDELGSFGDLKV